MIQVVAYHAQQATLNIDKGADKLEKARRKKLRNLKVHTTNQQDPHMQNNPIQFHWFLFYLSFFFLLLQRKTKILFWVVVVLVIVVLLLLFID